jgi:hypothetical protein
LGVCVCLSGLLWSIKQNKQKIVLKFSTKREPN